MGGINIVKYLVIKNIAYYPSCVALNGNAVMNAVLDTLQSAGVQTQENSQTADAAVIWSVLWNGRMRGNQAVYNHYRAQNKPVIIVETGALYRGNTWKISVNHVNATGYYGHLENLDPDRPRRLGISLAVNLSTNPAVLVAGQHNRSQQLAGVSQEQWITDVIGKIRSVADRPIHVRPHPRCDLDWTQLPPDIHREQPKKLDGTYDSFNIRFDYHAVVNYNSGPGTQAAIAGTRPIVHETSLAHPVSVAIQDIDQPYMIDRHRWLTEICHTEYTLEEIKQGQWLKRILPALTA
jgi:hypothetical protein